MAESLYVEPSKVMRSVGGCKLGGDTRLRTARKKRWESDSVSRDAKKISFVFLLWCLTACLNAFFAALWAAKIGLSGSRGLLALTQR